MANLPAQLAFPVTRPHGFAQVSATRPFPTFRGQIEHSGTMLVVLLKNKPTVNSTNQSMKKLLFLLAILPLGIAGCAQQATENTATTQPADKGMETEVVKTDAEWKQQLDKQAYHVLREQGTERPFSGAYYNNHDKGTYSCAGCSQPLFTSDEKFDSGTGWPSFWQPANTTCVASDADETHGMVRTEVHCSRCGGHLGHVFDDGPKPTGLRYCINSVSLDFKPTDGDKDSEHKH